MMVLITHETSGAVRNAFRTFGHEAYSCDVLPSEDNSPHHIQDDALAVIRNRKWDFIGMHPACTFLCGSGLHWNYRGRGWEKTEAALLHVTDLIKAAGTAKWYLENPVGIISTRIRKPDQIIQPYEFGEDASKKTCLWLNNLPLLRPTRRYQGRLVEWPKGSGKQVERWGNQTDSGQNRLAPSDKRWKDRSRTYTGVALAMAQQWGV